jgi:hypothetical protein
MILPALLNLLMRRKHRSKLASSNPSYSKIGKRSNSPYEYPGKAMVISCKSGSAVQLDQQGLVVS